VYIGQVGDATRSMPGDHDIVGQGASRSSAFAILFYLLFAIGQSAMIYGAFQDMRGRPFDIRASVRRGMKRFLPVIVAEISSIFLVILGFMLLIVPGFIFLTMVFVIVPACVVEGLEPLRSIGRSRELTKGHRWRVFALWLVPALFIGFTDVLFQ